MLGWQISQMRSFPPDLSSCAGRTCHWWKCSGLRACRGSPLCPWGVGGGCRSVCSRVCAHLTPQPFAVEGLCRSLSSALPAAGITAPFCVHSNKPLTTRSVPCCVRGRDPTCSHSVTPYGQFVFYNSRVFLNFWRDGGMLWCHSQAKPPLFLVFPIHSWLVLELSALLSHSLTQPPSSSLDCSLLSSLFSLSLQDF